MSSPLLLVIDDDANVRDAAREILQREGCTVLEAECAERGSAIAAQRRPDIVLLATTLPEGSGIQLCKSWQSDPALAGIPVLLVSDEPGGGPNQIAGWCAGAFGVVTKPLSPLVLLAQVRLLVRLNETRRRLEISEATTRALLNAPTHAAVLLDRAGRIQAGNKSAADALGVAEPTLAGRCLYDCLPTERAARYRAATEEVWQTRQACRFRDEAGARVRETMVYPVCEAGGVLSSVAVLSEDVTERERSQAALEWQRRQLLSVFDGIEELIYVADPETHELLYFNEALRATFGAREGDKCHQVLQGLEKPCALCTNDRILGKHLGRTHVWEFQNRRNGRWYRCVDKAIRWPDGRWVRCEMAVDIHDFKMVEAALRESEERFRAIADYTYDLECWVGVDGRLRWVNPAVERLTGYTVPECLNMAEFPRPLIAEADRARLAKLLRAPLDETSGHDVQLRMQQRDGALAWASAAWQPIYNDEGGCLGTRISFTDISVRKQVEADLRRLSQAVEAAGEAIVLTDLHGQIVHVNQAFERLTGYSMPEVLGRAPPLFENERPAAERTPDLWAKVQAGQSWHGRGVNRRRDGSDYHAEITISPIDDDEGHAVGYVAIYRDITEDIEREAQLEAQTAMLKAVNMELEVQWQELRAQQQQLVELNKELQRATAAAKEANSAKSDFLARMSHEIRTPMTAVLGFAENLLDGALSEAERAMAVQTIRRNGEYLLQIINDILDLSKIEAGRLEVERIAFPLAELLDEIRELMQLRADRSGLALEFLYDGPVPVTVCSDPTRLKQILINLIGNAIKFTERGGVRVVVTLERRLVGSPRLCFAIEDTGIGMTAEQVDGLFQAFQQADASTSRRFGGTGLGLTISRALAQMLGGEIQAESVLNVGSTFRVWIETGPLDGVAMASSLGAALPKRNASSTPAKQALPTLSGRLLLAEDGPDNQRLITFILKKAGLEVTVAENGQIAVEQARAARAAGTPFDLIILDIQMPVMDGYTAARTLREEGFDVPIIALTANAMLSDRERCLAVGCDAYASKPIDRRTLLQTIGAALQARATHPGKARS